MDSPHNLSQDAIANIHLKDGEKLELTFQIIDFDILEVSKPKIWLSDGIF